MERTPSRLVIIVREVQLLWKRNINQKNYLRWLGTVNNVGGKPMTNYEAIRNLTSGQIEKFLDQVFLTGFNTGYQSLVDPEIHDGNPFDEGWLNEEVEGFHALVENEAGEELIIDPLVNVITHIVGFDTGAIPDDISWQMQVVLPKGVEDYDENGL
jgi:hypothetical protein